MPSRPVDRVEKRIPPALNPAR